MPHLILISKRGERVRIKFNFSMLFLAGIAWLGLIGFVKEKAIYTYHFIVDCTTSAFVFPKTKIPILLSRSQTALKGYYKKFGGFSGASVINMSGHFIAKKAVNGIA